MQNPLENRRAIITGGANGIGKAIAEIFYKNNLKIWVIDKDSEGLKHLQQALPGINTTCLDLSDASALMAFFKELESEWGYTDILVNNAGLSRFKPLQELTVEEWDYILNTNLRAAFICAREFGRLHRGNA